MLTTLLNNDFIFRAAVLAVPSMLVVKATGPTPYKKIISSGVDVYCWVFGMKQVSASQEKIAEDLAFYANADDDLTLGAVTEEVLGAEGKVVERRVRRSRKHPFASFLVQTIRGQHFSQCLRTDSNVLVFERHARAIMATHGVRPTDAAKVLPLATALFFDHRTVDQIDAVAIPHAAPFKSARKDFSSRYFSWGRNAMFTSRC